MGRAVGANRGARVRRGVTRRGCRDAECAGAAVPTREGSDGRVRPVVAHRDTNSLKKRLRRPARLAGAQLPRGHPPRRAACTRRRPLARRTNPPASPKMAISPAAKKARRESAGVTGPDTVVVLDYGSQYTQLITRRVRELGVYAVLLPGDVDMVRRARALRSHGRDPRSLERRGRARRRVSRPPAPSVRRRRVASSKNTSLFRARGSPGVSSLDPPPLAL